MKEFKTWHAYFDFRHATTRNYRYICPPDVKDFLETVLQTSKTRHFNIKAGTILWRAQLGYDFTQYYQDDIYIGDIPGPYHSKRMKPLKGEATEGRANPKGIPYLYLSNKMETALSEVRPWLGSMISVGQFKLKKDLTIVNCSTTEKRHLIYLEEPGPEERERAVWTDIDKAFSEPVTLSDKTADYVPTQILAELFKVDGLDGIAYRSAFDGGHNVVLFDIDAADLINCFLYEVKKINFDFDEAGNPYFVKKHYEQKEEMPGGHNEGS